MERIASYSASYPNQYDKTRRFFLSAGGETHGKIKFTPKVYWTRHFDRYESVSVAIPPIGIPGIITMRRKYFGANLNATTQWKLGRTSMGVEFRNEGVRSNVLGKPMEGNRRMLLFEKRGAISKKR